MNLYYESGDTLAHHGIKGMKWGRRRFQNSDGSLTAAGRKRYVTVRQATKNVKQAEKDAVKALNNSPKKHTLREYGNAARAASKQSVANDKAYNKQLREERKAERNTPEAKAARRKKALKVGAAVAGTALAAYGAYKVHEYVRNENTKIRTKQGENAAHKLFDDMIDERKFIRERAEANPLYYNRDHIDNAFDDIDSRYEIRKKAVTKNYKNMAEKDSFRNAAENVLIDKIENRRKRDRFGNLI